MKNINVAKLNDAEVRLLNNCLCIAIEQETLGSSGGRGISDKQAVLGRRIVALALKLGIDTGWESKYIKSRNEIINKNGENI